MLGGCSLKGGRERGEGDREKAKGQREGRGKRWGRF